MSSSAAPMSEEQARDVLNRWAAKGFYRLRNMGEKIFINQIVASWVFTLRLQTHCEERSVSRAQEPYLGGPVDDRGQPPDAWDIFVERPGEFQERTDTLRVPHTERVLLCAPCGGGGKIMCGTCSGSGQTICPQCGGSGILRQQLTETVQGSQGVAVQSVRHIESPCACLGGRVRCGGCAGEGRVICPHCRGSGQVKTYDQLIVKFQHERKKEVINPTPVPRDWFDRLTGETLVDQLEPRIDILPPVNEEVDELARRMLNDSHHDAERKRILLQRMEINRITLHEVKYKYAGLEHQLWVCGNEQDVHAPNAPWNRSRLMWTIAITVGVIALLVAGLCLLLFMH